MVSDYAIVIRPSLINKYGVGDNDISQIILGTRHDHHSLFPITDWPAYVHESFPLFDTSSNKDVIKEGELKLIAWEELYKDTKDLITIDKL